MTLNPYTRDAPLIAKGRRIRQKHIGADRPKRSIPGRRFDGTPIYADRGMK